MHQNIQSNRILFVININSFHLALVALLLLSFRLGAQTKLSLEQADSLLLKRNLSLLATSFGVQAQKALADQARLYPNPNVSLEVSAYNPSNHRPLDIFEPNGQYKFRVEQLLLVARKRVKLFRKEQAAAKVAELELANTIRGLRWELRMQYMDLWYNQRLMAHTDTLSSLIQELSAGFEDQYEKGNIALKEISRLRSVLFDLQLDKLSLQTQIRQTIQQLQLLLGDEASVLYEADTPPLPEEKLLPLPTQLYTRALQSRPDYQARLAEQSQSEAMLAYQRSLAWPDVALSYSFDRAGDYVPLYSGLGFAFNLPVWDRNQHNIRAARLQQDQVAIQLEADQLRIRSEVSAALEKLQMVRRSYATLAKVQLGQMDVLFRGIVDNYRKQNISLLEFMDQLDSYRNTRTNQLELTRKLILSQEELWFQLGTNRID